LGAKVCHNHLIIIRSGGRAARAALQPQWRMAHHRDMQDGSRTGQLLAATPMLGDVNFRRTIVLVVEDDPEEGTLGVVLNRPSEIPVRQVLEPWTDLVTGPCVLFQGGPVSPDSALALALPRGESEPIGWRSLAGSELMSRIGLVDLGAPPELLADGIASLRVFAGYAGWGAGQLEAEIDVGAWLVLDGLPEDAFADEPDRLYPSVLRRQGGEMALLSTYPDDPVLN
jgi:putative transcriptional regulator